MPKRMRIVHVVTLVSTSGAFGGPTTVALSQLRELRNRGHDVLLLGLHDGTENPVEIEGVPVRLLPARTLVPGKGVLGAFHHRLPRVLGEEFSTADVVHVHAGRDLVTLAALNVAKRVGVPYVTQTHGMVMPRRDPLSRAFDAELLPLLRGAQRRFVLTDVEVAGLRAQLPCAALTRLANGVALPQARTRSLPTRPTVVFLARLHERKRVLVFAEVAAELSRRGVDVDCQVYGPDGGDLAALEAAVAAGAPVTYRGALDHEDALATLGRADVYVLPSVDEPFPMSVLEAMARATPCVITDTCGLAGLVGPRGGALVTDGTAVGLADAVEKCLVDWSGMSIRARDTARELFAIDVVVDRLFAAYTTPGRLPEIVVGASHSVAA